MKNIFLLICTCALLFPACIGDDIIMDTIPERFNIDNPLDSIQIGMTYQMEASFFNNIGQRTEKSITWISTNEAALSIDDNGLATSLEEGETTVVASVLLDNNSTIEDQFDIIVSEEPIVIIDDPEPTERTGQIETTSSYELSGDFILREQGANIILEFADNYQASSALPGLYVYLTNNPNTTNGAFEIGAVDLFEGSHSYLIEGVDINEYNYVLYFCKPFSVKVGDGEIE